MSTAHPRRSGAQVLIDQLRIHGTDTIFGVPGESYLAALDALYAQRNSIRYVICRQEGGAANMAEAYGKLTGKPGIAFVTRGPGATNASIGLHTGFQDSTPMILLVGQVAREARQRSLDTELVDTTRPDVRAGEHVIGADVEGQQRDRPAVRFQEHGSRLQLGRRRSSVGAEAPGDQGEHKQESRDERKARIGSKHAMITSKC